MAAATRKYIALDIGGSGGRCVVGTFDGQKLSLDTISRFNNRPVRTVNQVHWDALSLFSGIKQGLRQARQPCGPNPAGIGVDTMGVACALLDRHGQLVSNPIYHRLPQTAEIHAESFRRMSAANLFQISGLPSNRLDSLYYLLKLKIDGSPATDTGQTFLMLPDLLNYWLTGRTAGEYTVASTSHLLDARTKTWSTPLLAAMGFPANIFPEIVQPGQMLARLHPAVTEETGLGRVPVIATAGHDTAAAVAAVPATGEDCAFLSSGTWGLLGVVIPGPILTDKVAAHNFANEGGVTGTIRLLHNSINLWPAEECRRIWAKTGAEHRWPALLAQAKQARPFAAFINPDAPIFKLPENMPATIQAEYRQTGQRVPQTPGQIIRLVLESLAFKYRDTLDKLTDILGKRPQMLYIVGGGAQNKLLCRFTANALNLPVVAGPIEATSAGNILMQMIAAGDLADVDEGRWLVSASFPTLTYEPENPAAWHAEYQRYRQVTGLSDIG